MRCHIITINNNVSQRERVCVFCVATTENFRSMRPSLSQSASVSSSSDAFICVDALLYNNNNDFPFEDDGDWIEEVSMAVSTSAAKKRSIIFSKNHPDLCMVLNFFYHLNSKSVKCLLDQLLTFTLLILTPISIVLIFFSLILSNGIGLKYIHFSLTMYPFILLSNFSSCISDLKFSSISCEYAVLNIITVSPSLSVFV